MAKVSFGMKGKQARRVLQLDEMGLFLDASLRGDGRPSHVPTSKAVPESGSAAPKGGKKVTVIHGINFAGEALPPYIQFPTDATKAENYKLKAQILASLPQVWARYGYSKRRAFDVGFGMNPKGGMAKDSFFKYCVEYLTYLYPDAEDVPGRRVLLKLDSGPGRFNPDLQARLRVLGFIVFPGVPNGTEVGQEMDQMYAYAKTLCYKNRDELLRKRLQTDGDGATLTLVDVGHIIFGGDVAFSDGTSLSLLKAFDLAFDASHVQRACEKCGYLPSTRAALMNPRVRHEAVDEEDGSVDIAADPLGELYNKIERDNHDAVAILIEHGYTKATELKLWI